MARFKKILFVLGFLLITLSLPFPAFAARVPLTGSEEEFQCNSNKDCQDNYGAGVCENNTCMVETYGEVEEQLAQCNQTKEMNLSCYIIGTDKLGVTDGFTGQGDTYLNYWEKTLNGTKFIDPADPNNPKIITKGGATQTITRLIASLYSTPPASSTEYLADLGKSIGLISPAYAQSGVGFQGLRPILEIWKLFRNVAYVFFVLVFVIIGLFIMFRVKIDPKTVIGIQNAIPRIVIALLLVTFSYAIAGLLIDLIYVVAAIGIAIIQPPGSQNVFPLGLWNTFVSVGAEIPKLFGANVDGFKQAFTLGEFNNSNPNLIQFVALFWGVSNNITNIVTGILNPIATLGDALHVPRTIINTFQNGVFFPPSGIISLIITIILIFTFFKLFLALLRAYVTILLNIIFGPLRIMLGAFPGVEGFGGWFRDLISNLIVFPAVLLLLAVASKLVALRSPEPLWGPPMIHLPAQSFPVIGNIIGNWIPGLVGLGMLLLIARVPEVIQSFFAKKPFAFGTAIGQSIGAPIAPIVGTANFVTGVNKSVRESGLAGKDFSVINWVRSGGRNTGQAGGGAGPTTGPGSEALNLQHQE